jgi:hypothetical protein
MESIVIGNNIAPLLSEGKGPVEPVRRAGAIIGFISTQEESGYVFGTAAFTGKQFGPFSSKRDAREAIYADHKVKAKGLPAQNHRPVFRLTPAHHQMSYRRGDLINAAALLRDNNLLMGDPAHWAKAIADSLVFGYSGGCRFDAFEKLAKKCGLAIPLRIAVQAVERTNAICAYKQKQAAAARSELPAAERRAKQFEPIQGYRPMRPETVGRLLGITAELRRQGRQRGRPLRTIAACDETPAQAVARRLEDKRAYDCERRRRARAAAGCLQRVSKPPLTDEERKARERERGQRRRASKGATPRSQSLSKTQPWLAAGFNSRRTWERHGKPQPTPQSGTHEPMPQLRPRFRRPRTKSLSIVCRRTDAGRSCANPRSRPGLPQSTRVPAARATSQVKAPADRSFAAWLDTVDAISRATVRSPAAFNAAIMALGGSRESTLRDHPTRKHANHEGMVGR